VSKLVRALALVMALFVGCSAAATPTSAPPPTPQPITVTDDLGRTVQVAPNPQRIASLAPSITEILFAVGAGDRIVATDDYSDYPAAAKAKPRVGSPFPGFNMEKLIAGEPQLVLSVKGKYVDDFIARGLTVVVLDPKDLDSVFKKIELVGGLVGVPQNAAQLVSSLKLRRDAVVAKTASLPKPRVFYEIDATEPAKPWTAGPGSFVQALVELAGGKSIGSAGATDYFQMSAEEVIKADPEIILLADAAYGVTVESVKGRPGWSGMTAVKKSAIYAADPDLTSRSGPRLVDGLELLAKTIHPEAFK